MVRRLACPRCKSTVEVEEGAKPVCWSCGYGSAGAAPSAPPPSYEYTTAYVTPQASAQKPDGKAIAAMVLGIVGICLTFIPYVQFGAIVLLILAIIFGAISLKAIGRDPSLGGKGMAIAGLVLGIVGIAFWILAALVIFSFLAAFGEAFEEYCDENPDDPDCQVVLDDGPLTLRDAQASARPVAPVSPVAAGRAIGWPG